MNIQIFGKSKCFDTKKRNGILRNAAYPFSPTI